MQIHWVQGTEDPDLLYLSQFSAGLPVKQPSRVFDDGPLCSVVPVQGILQGPADPFGHTAGHLVVRGGNREQPKGNCTALDGAAERGASLIGL